MARKLASATPLIKWTSAKGYYPKPFQSVPMRKVE
uniref:Uncharacterized protein n=1 Tax=Arundo donax TaxID=35708 RepID=A0A0A8Y8I2_ARUDO